MARFNNYLAAQDTSIPGSEEWLKMIGQQSVLAPDQAQQSIDQSLAPPGLRDDNAAQAARMSTGASMPINGQNMSIPVIPPMRPSSGLDYYISPETRALTEQYKDQARQSLNDQRAGISQLEQMRSDFADKPQGFNWAPVGAMADMLNEQFGHKTNLEKLGQDNRPMSEDEKNDKLLKLQEYIQTAKGTMSKESLAGTQQILNMLHQNDMARHYANVEKAANDRSQAFLDRNNIARDNQTQHAGDIFDKDSLLKTLQQRKQQISIDRDTLEKTDVIPYQIMNEMSTGLAAALSGSKAVGLEQTKMQELHSLEGDVAKARSYSGKPMNSLTADQRQFLQKTFTRLENAYQLAMQSRYDQLRNGRNYTYNPEANKSMDAKGAAYRPPVDEFHQMSDDEIKKQYDALGK